MKLRHRADWRTLVWALALMPGLFVVQLRWPVLAGWFLPLSMYASYSAAVIAHNHNHCPTFVGRRANSIFSTWISIFYGFPTYGWIPTHNENHHRYVGRAGDATVIVVPGAEDRAWIALTHFFRSSKTQGPLLARYRERLYARSKKAWLMILAQYVVVYGVHVVMCALAIHLHGWRVGGFVYLTALFIPAFMALWGVQFTNWVQHVGCDPQSKWNHSRNFCSSWMNYFVFDNGFHTVHHARAGMHWSEARAAHAKIAHRIDPRLNDSSIFAYALRPTLPGSFDHQGPRLCEPESTPNSWNDWAATGTDGGLMYAEEVSVVVLRRSALLFLLAASTVAVVGCSAKAGEDDLGSDESNLTESDAAFVKIRDAVKDVEQEHVTFAEGVKAPTESAGSGATGTGTSLYGVDWFQKWAGGKTADHDWNIGSDYGKRCMWASVARYEAIMKDAPPELAAYLAEYSQWGGGFYNWNDDYGGKSEDGRPAFGDAKGARLWAWRTSLTKWISQTAKDGSCYLPTRSMLVKYVATCKAHAAANGGEMQGCEARSE